MKYSPGAIEVIVTQTASETAVHVVDEGPSLEPDLIAHLFEPFSRGSSVRVGGLGLGLNVCKRLVEAYGGKLWAENRKTGGAIFAFSSGAAGASGVLDPLRVTVSAAAHAEDAW